MPAQNRDGHAYTLLKQTTDGRAMACFEDMSRNTGHSCQQSAASIARADARIDSTSPESYRRAKSGTIEKL